MLPAYSAFLLKIFRYQQLLNTIDDLGKDVRPALAGNKTCTDRMKRTIAQARALIRECHLEAEMNVRRRQADD